MRDPSARWLTSEQAAVHAGISLSQFHNALQGGRLQAHIRKIAVLGPTRGGRIRVDRDSLSWSLGLFKHVELDLSDEPLPRWATIRQAAEYYQISTTTVRHLIAAGQLKAKRIGKVLRIERESLLHLGEYPPRKYENRL